MKEWGKNIMEESSFPKWKEELLLNGYANLDERVEEIKKNGENHQMLPIGMRIDIRIGITACGSVFYLRPMARWAFCGEFPLFWQESPAARSLGGSLMNNLQEMVYTGKTGRKLGLAEIAGGVGFFSAGVYILLYLIMTIFCVFPVPAGFVLNVPLASMVYYGNSTIPRFAITIGGYWWFQLGVGLGAVLIMTLIFCASMLLTKSFYAGSAISVGVSLLLLGMIQMVPETAVFFVPHCSPIGLFLQAGHFCRRGSSCSPYCPILRGFLY